LGYLYGVLVEHVRKRLLGGESLGDAGVENLRHGINRRHQVNWNLRGRPGLVASIVKYRSEGGHAG